MSESEPEQEGFRSRNEQLLKRQQIRKKIYQEYIKHQKNVVINDSKVDKYVGISKSLVKTEKQQSDNEIDMFGDDLNRNEDKVREIEVTDESGYYNIVSGKIIGGKYKLVEKIGKGMFGIVGKVEVIGSNTELAVKIIRKNEMMMASGQRQYKMLKKLKQEYIVGVVDYFHEDGHLFLICELMGSDLRSYMHKNQNRISLQLIKEWAISMFLGLHQLKKNRIIHADIKPDNYLLTKDPRKIKLSDFGTSYHVEEHSEDVEYLVARYYRAPQIILGCVMPAEQRYGIDVWAVGCTLFELFTGKFLFEGLNNNQMLRVIMQTRGKFNNKLLKKAKFLDKYFDGQFNFLSEVYDSNTKQITIKKIQVSITPERELLNLLKRYSRFEQDMKVLFNFKDFLEGCLSLNPKNRFSADQAFRHPFLNYQVKLD